MDHKLYTGTGRHVLISIWASLIFAGLYMLSASLCIYTFSFFDIIHPATKNFNSTIVWTLSTGFVTGISFGYISRFVTAGLKYHFLIWTALFIVVNITPVISPIHLQSIPLNLLVHEYGVIVLVNYLILSILSSLIFIIIYLTPIPQ